MTAADDSLTHGLRTLALLACRGPLDIGRLARLNGVRVEEAEAVVDALREAGLVRRVGGRGGFTVTERAAALVGAERTRLH